ncbi:ribonuclease H-like domain-containing protein [Tanacetum coccineum]
MDLESTQNNDVAKLPLLKQESGNSFKTVARFTTNADGTSTSTIPGVVIAEERIQKKNDVKARIILMMALPNEHLLTFNQYKDAKTLFEAIEARFGGIDATKKIQKTLLKQTYENFNASSSKSLDSMFNRLQKLVSQLSILGENISQEDLNLKFLRSLPAEWNTHVIVEQEVKRSGSSSSNSGSKNMAFVSTPDSTNEDTAYVQVSTDNTPVSAASTNDNAANLKQIHDDDLEEIDLKWQLALLSMRARRFYQRTGKKITINGSDTAGFDKTKVECFNCHKLGHFARECRNPRSQESRTRSYDQGSKSQDNLRRTVKVEDTSSKAMVAIDGAGFDWSYIAEEEVPTNIALMAFSESKVYNDKICFNTCLKSFETLKTQYDNLRVEFNKSEFDLANYKRGLASLEEQLVFYKKNKIEIEKLKKDKQDNLIKIDNYENASKSLDKLIGSQLTDNNKKGVGYNAVPPPPTGLFAPPTIDLSNTGLEKFKQPKFKGYGPKANKSVCVYATKEVKKTSDAPIIEDWVSDSNDDESVTKVSKFDNVQHKPEQANKPRNVRQNPSFNHLIKDCNFHDKKVVQKPVLNNVQKGTGQREGRPIWNNAMRTNHQNFSNFRRNFTPTAVLTKSGKVSISTARQSSSRAAVPISAARPINTAAPKSFVNAGALAFGCRCPSSIAPAEPGHMTGNKSSLTDYQEYDGGFVAFAGSSKGGKITGKGKFRTGNLDFEDVYFVKEHKFNLFSVSQMCDKKNSVLFTKNEWFILSSDFKLPDENQVMLKIHRKDNMYSFDLKNIVPSRFSWVFFLAKKDETSGILKNFITGIENQLNHKVKVIRCDNGTEFKNYEMNQLCGIKGIKREFSNARTPQQNRVAERKNKTLIEAARTTVLVTKPHNKTPYELLLGRTPIVSFMRHFGYPVTILNTLDHLVKFDGKADEGVLVGYSINSKAFRVYNHRTRIVEENLHVNFLENKPNVAGNKPEWLFNIDSLTNTVNYQPVSAGNRTNGNAGIETNSDAGQAGKNKVPDQEYILLPLMHTSSYVPSINQEKEATEHSDDVQNQFEAEFNKHLFEELDTRTSNDSLMPNLEDTAEPQGTGIFSRAYDDDDDFCNSHFDAQDVGAEADFNNMEPSIIVSPIPITRIHSIHPKAQIIGDLKSAVQTRRMTKQRETGLISFINKQRRTNHKDFQNCLFAYFLSQDEPKKITQALDDESWVEAMQEELLQFKLLNVDTGGFTSLKESHWY